MNLLSLQIFSSDVQFIVGGKMKKSLFAFIVLSLFVPITVFYCFLLSKYIDNNYITCGIILFFTDIFCSTSYFFIIKEYRGFLIFIFSLIFNIITIIIYCKLIFDEITGSKITILIFMAIIMIIYI